MRIVLPACLLLFLVPETWLPAAESYPTPAEARVAMNEAIVFYRTRLACEGGYLWRYKAGDLSVREGEGKAGMTTIWVQPPGTPSVGEALLEAWQLTGEKGARDGAVAAGHALVRGQMKAGGWNYRIEFDPDDRVRWAYRGPERHRRKARHTCVLDDNTTQAALSFLMKLDRALDFKDAKIHDAVVFGLQGVLAAQFDNGAFPQAFDGSRDPAACVDRKARLPETWSRSYQGHQQYWYRPTLNDNVLADVIAMLFLASEVYGEPQYRQAALKAGDFLLRAQLPEPQPGWAQQYNFEMEPMWARKFEPPAITGGEARGAMETLIFLWRKTGDKKWIAPLPRALDYYESRVLSDGRLARFYELGTDKPLYFTKDYKLTYDDGSMPTHYAFKIKNWVPALRKNLARGIALPVSKQGAAEVGDHARQALQARDKDLPVWVNDGWIECREFNRRIVDLARWVGMKK